MLKYYLVYCLVFMLVDKVIGRTCNDCVTFSSCLNARELASKHRNTQTENKIRNAFCGFENGTPKVCCSDFDEQPVLSTDNINNHRNARLLPTSCGNIDGKRIIGGTTAGIYEFPWMVLISYDTREGLQFLCGGSVINSRYVLTAAHCVQNKRIAGVRIGEFDIRYKTDCQPHGDEFVCESNIQDIGVENSTIHESYIGLPTVVNDIALLRLESPIDFNFKNAAPICLPRYTNLRRKALGGEIGTVAGWGLTETNRDSSVLLKVDIPILSSSQCYGIYNKKLAPGERGRIENEFCAGALGKDSCNGDSGGPLMLNGQYEGESRVIQYGIVSRGPKQCGSKNPGIYTNVVNFMGWILDNITE